jgi:S-formylglutathione hydrolase FrmB
MKIGQLCCLLGGLWLATCGPQALAQAPPKGKVLEGRTLKSAILGREVRYTLYLPPDYDLNERRYPVTYLLHGYTDDDTGWLQFGEVNRLADAAIASGDIPPMIIAMPDGGVAWYINSHDGKTKYEDFFIKEFLPHIDATYRTRPKREFRAVAGLSMGGYGSLIYALKYPDLFAACGALSAAVRTDAEIEGTAADMHERIFGPLFGPNLAGKARLTEAWYKNSVLKLVETAKLDDLKKVRWWIDCGDGDFLIRGNLRLAEALTDRAVPFELRFRDGVHDWTYWRTGLIDALRYVGVSFRR